MQCLNQSHKISLFPLLVKPKTSSRADAFSKSSLPSNFLRKYNQWWVVQSLVSNCSALAPFRKSSTWSFTRTNSFDDGFGAVDGSPGPYIQALGKIFSYKAESPLRRCSSKYASNRCVFIGLNALSAK